VAHRGLTPHPSQPGENAPFGERPHGRRFASPDTRTGASAVLANRTRRPEQL